VPESGSLLLEGSAEFNGQLRVPDLMAIGQAGGAQVLIRIIPTAAGPDNRQACGGENNVRWFRNRNDCHAGGEVKARVEKSDRDICHISESEK
jgi:hypothetical protein